MCLIVRKEDFILQTAQEDKVVYKEFVTRLNNRDEEGLYTPYMGTEYRLDELMKAEIGIDGGLGAYSNTDYQKMIDDGFYPNRTNAIGIGPGLHYIVELEDYREELQNSDIYECIIPKGSQYIEAWGLGVANQLIVKRKI